MISSSWQEIIFSILHWLRSSNLPDPKKRPCWRPTTWATWSRSRSTGSITLGKDGVITAFRREAPKSNQHTLTGIALYYFPAEVVQMIKTYIAEGNNPDQPGRLIQWLYPRVPVHTWRVPGRWFDVGSKETLEEAESRIFGQ